MVVVSTNFFKLSISIGGYKRVALIRVNIMKSKAAPMAGLMSIFGYFYRVSFLLKTFWEDCSAYDCLNQFCSSFGT